MFDIDVEGFTMVMEVLGLVVGVVGAFLIFFVFMPEKNRNRYTGWIAKLYNLLNFRFYIIEGILKFGYVLGASLCTAMGLFMALTIVKLTPGLVLLVGGNLIVRIIFEFLMMLVKACRNLGERQNPEYIEKGAGDEAEAKAAYEEASATRTEAPKKVIIKKKAQAEAAASEEAPVEKPGYKICPSCGAKCSSKFVFCNICGTKL